MGGELFSFAVTKDGIVRVFWQGRCVTTVRGRRGVELGQALGVAGEEEVQHLLRRVTGNFKRGNERAKRSRKVE